MMAALNFQSAIDKLVLVEPNPFYLLNQSGFAKAYAEPILLKENIKKYYTRPGWKFSTTQRPSN